MPIPFLVVGAIFAAGMHLVGLYQRRRDARVAVAVAHAAGLEVELDSGAPPGTLRHRLFEQGRAGRVRLQMREPGSPHSVFHYTYVTGAGKNRRVNKAVCALVALPFVAPRSELAPEHAFRGIARAFGFGDIEVESPTFNERYAVTSDDERFAITLLDQPMIAFLLSPEARHGEVRFDLADDYLLVEAVNVPPIAGYPALLECSRSLPSRFPTVLQSLYPIGGGR